MKGAGGSALEFARLLGPGGFVFGAVQGFARVISLKTIAVAALAKQFYDLGRAAVDGFSQVRDEATRTSLAVSQNVSKMRAELSSLVGGTGFSPAGMAALAAGGSVRSVHLAAEAAAVYGTDVGRESARLAQGAARAGLTVDAYAARSGLTGVLEGPHTPQQRSRLFAARNEAAMASFGAGLNELTGLGNISVEFDRRFLGNIGQWLTSRYDRPASAPGGYWDDRSISERVNRLFGHHEDYADKNAHKLYANRADYWTRTMGVQASIPAAHGMLQAGINTFGVRTSLAGLPAADGQDRTRARARFGAELLAMSDEMARNTRDTGDAFREFRLGLREAATAAGDFGSAIHARARAQFDQAVTAYYAGRGYGTRGPSQALSDLPGLPAWLEALRPTAYPDQRPAAESGSTGPTVAPAATYHPMVVSLGNSRSDIETAVRYSQEDLGTVPAGID